MSEQTLSIPRLDVYKIPVLRLLLFLVPHLAGCAVYIGFYWYYAIRGDDYFAKSIFTPVFCLLIGGSLLTLILLLRFAHIKSQITSAGVAVLCVSFGLVVVVPLLFHYCYDNRAGDLLHRISNGIFLLSTLGYVFFAFFSCKHKSS